MRRAPTALDRQKTCSFGPNRRFGPTFAPEFRVLSRLAIFSICSANYAPQARTFFQSARAQHPEADLYLCLVDLLDDATGHFGPDVRVIQADGLGIREFPNLAFRYDVMELNTAVKPFMFRHLFHVLGYDIVLYFDPDIEIYRPLAGIVSRLEQGASIVLSPHLLSPSEGGGSVDDMTIMRAGIYNLGFVAVRACKEALDVVDWWARRLRYFCVNDQPKGLFVDQRFMDLVPGFAPHCHVSHDATLNVAYWNIRQRPLAERNGIGLVDGSPLTFFHYSGFDPDRPGQLSRHDPTVPVPRGSALGRLTQAYAGRLVENGHGSTVGDRYAYGHFASGTNIPRIVREMFRTQHSAWPDDPFETFEAFLNEPNPGPSKEAGGGRVATNLMHFLHEHYPWLRNRLDLARPDHVRQLVEWFVLHAHPQLHLDLRLVYPAAARIGNAPPATRRTPPGPRNDATVTAVGYLRAISGIGEASRQTVRSLLAAGVPVEGFDAGRGNPPAESDESLSPRLRERGSGSFQIFNVNADQLAPVLGAHGELLRQDALRVCIPFWELSGMPAAWIASLEKMDEIWAPSRFVQTAMAARLSRPVVHMPVAIETGAPAPVDRARFGLPEGRFLFYFAFDSFSFLERKNPVAAVRAFRKAFPTYGTAGLVLKSLNIDRDPDGAEALAREIDGHPDIFWVRNSLPRADVLGLMAAADAILSLHRSEGLGLLVAEAMCLRKAVIATDYSATQDFLSDDTGYPVEVRLVPVRPGDYPHHEGQVWADPDIAHAAWLMRRLRNAPEIAAQRVEAASRLIRNRHSPAEVGKAMRERIEWRLGSRGGPPATRRTAQG